MHCEINQAFEIKSNDLHSNINPKSSEAHLEFFWCNGSDLDDENLQPYLFRNLIKNYINGKKDVWWESSLKIEIDELKRG